ncbi:hypothetical protein [Roseobacter weihaiensis]|uniref:hypothetical protein n=1 Tax=Roseobacter weihaiensis TaxID=2763262 RepID=UPI001D0BA2F7|nr:hypothetical protein [Roseobacter sp. H9]
MSDRDSFIDEVNDEVRRDRFYFMLRRYGWIAALAVVLIVGGAAWNEFRKAQDRAQAENLGDEILAALSARDPGARFEGLDSIEAETLGAQAVVDLLVAAEAQQAGNITAAVAALDGVALNLEAPPIYRQVAAFKSLVLQGDTLDSATRRQQFEALASPGAPLSLMAQEQLALIDIEEGQTQAAIAKYQAILQDAGVSADLQQRALQVIVALGGSPEISNLPGIGN